ncbi:four-carbon acid sugar kinase family protein [Homoserinibacter sp. YIM 151385]|uniref:four-carbon acid sugar kinase family protein n=1 Tax=Homoserinibacter sp. YIM 151385 TaxID=2985506 RepID=UPI0022EFEED1|nr:four-carbon acid sugar kinase family protein [Homoserinibacter sp. YIM 151385]WBU38088.1 four-carbon acid sugar kinase family protein [Homoserinibacter sp. YIM 151385]
MKTIVLDDDPTGTQSATGVRVLLEHDAELVTEALQDADSVYVQTNSRALHEADAVALVRRIREEGLEAGRRLQSPVRFVLRGDSTLRGHVFAETEVLLDADPDAVMLFVPAFPDGGRTTRGGVHYVRVDGEDLPAHESEYADDPVFPFRSGVLVDYVAEKSDRDAVAVDLDTVRAGGLAAALRAAPAGAVVLPDAETADDIRRIAAAVDKAGAAGTSIVVRSAAPLAAELAGAASAGLLTTPLIPSPLPTLLVCGSHTIGATRQLAPVRAAWGEPAEVDTEAALADPAIAGAAAAAGGVEQLGSRPLALLMTARERSGAHGTLDHGERVMAALTTAVRGILPAVDVVVAKGGITSAEVARTGIGARSALVLGQVLPGVSVWQMDDHTGRQILYIVVPGNVGDEDTLERVLDALRLPLPQ